MNAGPDGQMVKQYLDKRSIYDQKESDHIGSKKIAFPSVKAGSIIEYRYRSQMKHYGGLDEWVFQDQYPVMVSRYTLYVVPNAEFAYRVNKRDDIPVSIRPNNDAGKIFFEMDNIPALNDEPYMDTRADYLQKVIFQLSGFHNRDNGKEKYMASWDDVIKNLQQDDDFGLQLNKKIAGSADLINQLSNMTAERKMEVIYNYVRRNMSWNHSNSRTAIDGVKTAWQKRSGTSGEINLLMINLMKYAGLEVYPVLVSERWHGKVNTDYPFIDQFNTVFANVVIGDKKYFLNAVDQFTPAQLIPYNILNTTALVVDRKKGGIIRISNESLQYSDDIYNSIEVKEDGSFTGNASIKSSDYARVTREKKYKEDKDDFFKDYFYKGSDAVLTGDFKIVNLENDSLPLEQYCHFSKRQASDNGYVYIPLDLFSGFDKNPFLADERFSNINFGYKRNISIVSSILLPKNYLVDVLPAATRIVNVEKDIVITRQADYDKPNNTIHSTVIIEFKNGLYTANAYPNMKALYKKVFSMLKEPVVLKKKP